MSTLLPLIGTVVDRLYFYRSQRKEQVIQAIKSISKAWAHTYDYLVNRDGISNPNLELSDLWNKAASETRLVDNKLGIMLQQKSRFWIHPDLPRQGRILKLKEITDKIERLEKTL